MGNLSSTSAAVAPPDDPKYNFKESEFKQLIQERAQENRFALAHIIDEYQLHIPVDDFNHLVEEATLGTTLPYFAEMEGIKQYLVEKYQEYDIANSSGIAALDEFNIRSPSLWGKPVTKLSELQERLSKDRSVPDEYKEMMMKDIRSLTEHATKVARDINYEIFNRYQNEGMW